jgi:hypothetical protein
MMVDQLLAMNAALVSCTATAAPSRSPPIHLPAAAAGTDEPPAPIEHGRFGVVPGSQLGGIGLDLRAASQHSPSGIGGPGCDFYLQPMMSKMSK